MEKVRTAAFGYVAGSSMREAVRKVIELWKRTDPLEVQNWLKANRIKRENLLNDGGFTKSGEFMQLCSIPQFVHLWIVRLTGDSSWTQNDPELLRIVLDEMPEARINTKSGTRLSSDHR